ncbi:ATP-binding protein [Mastigocladopsis repens]|uniref:ATP-binding protein n=1 Tax=Mastigocladopsis repens TaxID=221287 RepID=UPI0002F24806|nr:ATP-binding protein [Mastigocladopsis repens]
MLRSLKQWLYRLKVGQKIGLGYTLALGIAISGMVTGSLIGSFYQRQARKLIEDAIEENVLIESLQINLLYAHSRQKSLAFVLSEPEKFWQEYSLFREHIAKARQAWSRLKDSYAKPEIEELTQEVEAFEQLVKKYDNLIEITYFQEIEKLVQQMAPSKSQLKDVETSQKLLVNFNRGPVAFKFESCVKSIDEVEHLVTKEKIAALANLKAMEKLWVEIMLLSIVLSVLTSTLFAIQTSQAISHPLKMVTNLAQKVTQQANFDLQVPVISKDELGVLASSFNYLLQFVRQLFEDQKEANKQLHFYSSNLEEKVQERTQELIRKNLHLQQILRELQLTQAQLMQSEKMSSLGQMVAGIAHEINNPVSFIQGNLIHAQAYTQDLLELIQIYQQHYPIPPKEIQEKIKAIELDFITEDLTKLLNSMSVGTQRITKIVLELRNFSRLNEAEFKKVDIHEGIDSTLMILEHRLKATHEHPQIKVIKEYGQLPLVFCYPGQLNQVFMNTFANAIDALEEAARNSKPPAPMIRIRTQVLDNNWMVIRILDNGSGMTEEVRSKLFDPFFTTKPVGKGTGLGLSISYQIIVEKHGGTLEVNSALGEGTEFVISIPIKQSQ